MKLGPLPAETRTLPESVTAVIVNHGNGCFDLTVNLFAEHTEDTRYCTANSTLSVDSHAKHQQIGAVSPTATMTYDPATIMSPEESQHPLACTMDLAGGPVTISACLEGTASRGLSEERMIGGQTVDVTPLRISYDVTGDLSGTWNESLLADRHEPPRADRASSRPVGSRNLHRTLRLSPGRPHAEDLRSSMRRAVDQDSLGVRGPASSCS